MIKRLNLFVQGFTLIELLVVISIIAILVGFGAARYMTAEKGARDTTRKSDLNQYRIALENYASSNNSLYPAATNGEITNLCDTGSPSFKNTYLSGVCLDDPLSSYHYYYYRSSDLTSYVLSARLEKTGKYYYVCSSGKTGTATSAPSSCP